MLVIKFSFQALDIQHSKSDADQELVKKISHSKTSYCDSGKLTDTWLYIINLFVIYVFCQLLTHFWFKPKFWKLPPREKQVLIYASDFTHCGLILHCILQKDKSKNKYIFFFLFLGVSYMILYDE